MTIKHVEDISVERLNYLLQHINEYEVTEKIDGSTMQFGLDTTGFFTTRYSKNGTRYYGAESYPINFSTTYLRLGHLALLKILGVLMCNGFTFGDVVEAEVLYTEYPNVLRYDGKTRIVFLRDVKGNTCNNLANLDGKVVNVSIDVPHLVDNKIETVVEHHQVEICVNRPIKTNLNNFVIAGSDKNEIKQQLLKEFVYNKQSRFGDKDSIIEGVVLRHRMSNDMIKIVDKDVFLQLKNFLWNYRDKVSSNSFGKPDSIISHLYEKLGNKISLDKQGTSFAKGIVTKLGDINQVIDGLTTLPEVNILKVDCLSIINDASEELNSLYDEYSNNWTLLLKEIQIGDRLYQATYNDEIHRRTLQTFFIARQLIDKYQNEMNGVSQVKDVIRIIIQRHFKGEN